MRFTASTAFGRQALVAPSNTIAHVDAGYGADIRARDESNSCTVVALAVVSGKSYDQSRRFLARRGRLPRSGFNLWGLFDLMRLNSETGVVELPELFRLRHRIQLIEYTRYPGATNRERFIFTEHRPTFRRFAREHDDGHRYLIFSRHHVAAVVGGKLYDQWASGNLFVERFIRLIPV